jgi:hypothetical protein
MRQGSEQALIDVVREAWTNDVSTRKIDSLVKAIGIEGLGAAQVITAAVLIIAAEPMYGESEASGRLPDGIRGRQPKKQVLSESRGDRTAAVAEIRSVIGRELWSLLVVWRSAFPCANKSRTLFARGICSLLFMTTS